MSATVVFCGALGNAFADNYVGVSDSNPGLGTPLASVNVANGSNLANVDISTGAGLATLPIEMPHARGRAQPQLALHYNSQRGIREAGFGWSFDLPVITRHPVWGLPRYPEVSNPNLDISTMDRYEFAGQPLVPICKMQHGVCTNGRSSGEEIESWSDNWFYFRLQNEGLFARFYLSSDFTTWRILMKDSTVIELGKPLVYNPAQANIQPLEAIDVDATVAPSAYYRWNISAAYDLEAGFTPKNLVAYTWRHLDSANDADGVGYLTELHFTPPSNGSPADANFASYAHHIYVSYTFPYFSLPLGSGFAMMPNEVPQRFISGIDVTSKLFGDTSSARELVRRYHLTYLIQQHHWYLASLQVEGKCPAPNVVESSERLPSSNCPSLPATTLAYTPDTTADRSVTGLNPGVTPIHFSQAPHAPVVSGQPINIAAIDANGDGLTDLVQPAATATGDPPPMQTLFLRDATQQFPVAFLQGVSVGISPSIPLDPPVTGVTAADLLSVGDQPGIHDPVGRSFIGDWTADDNISAIWTTPADGQPGHAQPVGLYALTATPGFAWTESASSNGPLSPDTINVPPFTVTSGGSTAPNYFLGADLNGDGLLDDVEGATNGGNLFVRFSTRNAVDGTVDGKIHPFESSVSTSLPSDLVTWMSESFAAIGDINGDGLPDIAMESSSTVMDVYLGNGKGAFEYVRYSVPPDPYGETNLQLADLNGDGLADLIKEDQDGVRVYLNIDGANFEADAAAQFSRSDIAAFFTDGGGDQWNWLGKGGTDTDPSQSNYPSIRVLIGDMDGNGVSDLVFVGQTSGVYVDFLGGTYGGPVPGLLSSITNGGGATTYLFYQSSTQQMALAGGWTYTTPQVVDVVSERQTVNGLAGTPASQQLTSFYSYNNPGYDAWRHQFLGFREVDETDFGPTGPGIKTRNTYEIETCQGRTCAPGDNSDTDSGKFMTLSPHLTSQEVVSDDGSRLLKRTVWEHEVDDLVAGADGDGRTVRFAYPHLARTQLFDTNAAAGAMGSVNVVGSEWTDPNNNVHQSTVTIPATGTPAGTTPVNLQTRTVRDNWGTVFKTYDDGHVDASWAPIDQTIETDYTSNAVPDRGLVTSLIVRPFAHVTGVPDSAGTGKSITYHYNNATGDVTDVIGDLEGTIPLDRFHATGGAIAPAPTGASTGGNVTLTHYLYDGYGNMTQETGPSGRSTTYSYDPGYQQLLTLKTVSVPGGVLQQSLAYDRGLEVESLITNSDGSLVNVIYDGFGRAINVFGSDPTMMWVEDETSRANFEYGFTDSNRLQYTHQTTGEPDGKESYVYTDGLGETILSVQANNELDGTTTPWVASGVPTYGDFGKPIYVSKPWGYSGTTPDAFPAAFEARPPDPQRHLEYDPFGRLSKVTDYDAKVALQRLFYPLSIVTSDGVDVSSSNPNHGTPTTVNVDGHGRTTSVVDELGASDPTAPGDVQTTNYDYLSTGEVARIQRIHGSDPTYTRWMQYDSFGRMVLNAEPNTSKNFSPDPQSISGMHAWRYAYDDAGDLVGTSDARGCGENIFRDSIGRNLGEDFSPCLASQPTYTVPTVVPGSIPQGTETAFKYDSAETGETSADYGVGGIAGKVAVAYSRGAHDRYGYDARGRLTNRSRTLADPGNTYETYTPTWYRSSITYDYSDEIGSVTTGADQAGLMVKGHSVVSYNYSSRGHLAAISGSYGTLVSSYGYDPSGNVTHVVYGDAAQTSATVSLNAVDLPSDVGISRSAPAIWTSPPTGYVPPDSSTTQTSLLAEHFDYDEANNLTAITADASKAPQWPQGAKPMSRSMQYDSLYRLLEVDYDSGGDTSVNPFLSEETNGSAAPVPVVTGLPRIQQQTRRYDYLGNTKQTDDNQHALYDRSLGITTPGGAAHPNQIVQFGSASSPNVTYDDAGNLVNLVVQRTGNCAGPTHDCTQRFVYDWDELGRLARARRWDYSMLPPDDPAYPAVPSGTPQWDVTYQYDAFGGRTIKSFKDATNVLRYSAEIFDTLRLDGAQWLGSDYERTATTEKVYLPGAGRLVSDSTLPYIANSPLHANNLHVFLEMGDSLGSSAVVIDKDTSEVVERSTYQAFGEIESDYRPTRWGSFREPYQYTGKEADIQVGATYFGARYYQPLLGTWMSADPLAIHGTQGDLNPYAFVGNSPMQATDPTGLQEEGGGSNGSSSDNDPSQWTYSGGGGYPGGGGGGGGGRAGNGCGVMPGCTGQAGGGSSAGQSAYSGTGGVTHEGASIPRVLAAELHGYNAMAIGMSRGAASAVIGSERTTFDLLPYVSLLDAFMFAGPPGIMATFTNWGTIGSFGDGVSRQLAAADERIAPKSSRDGWYYLGFAAAAVAIGILTDGAGDAILGAGGGAAAVGTVDTAAIRFSQSSIGQTLRSGENINDVARALQGPAGDALAASFKPIRIFKNAAGDLVTLDNRRLLIFSLAGREIPYVWATPAEVAAQSWKLTATVKQMGGLIIPVGQ